MNNLFEHEILFDDVASLENLLGRNALKTQSANANCDCVSYTAIQDDDVDPQESPRVTPASN